MILDRVTLDNFGAYAGRHEALLTPEPGKPVILFGGMNGGGKTTLLDSIQLGFYGSNAKTSNRGGMAYRDFLAECIHRGADPEDGASIAIEYHRMAEGRVTRYELRRSWRSGPKGVEETLRVYRDGEPDELLTEHWDESIGAYLPVGIAHLFFFDGEQIKDLAEGQNSARIIGTAVHSLLGLDLVDRLEGDLRVFERRKKAATLDTQAMLRLKRVEEELDHLLEEEARVLQEEGQLTNEAGRIAEKVSDARKVFDAEGGNLFLRQDELEKDLVERRKEMEVLQDELRRLAAGGLPLLLIEDQLTELQELAQHENSIRHNRLLVEAMEKRDATIVEILNNENLSASSIKRVIHALVKDRKWRVREAGEKLILDADPGFETVLMHLKNISLPTIAQRCTRLLGEIARLNERIARLEADLARVPDQDRIATAQEELRRQQIEHDQIFRRLSEVEVRKKALRTQCERAKRQLEQIGLQEVDARFSEDARKRMLKHSTRVRRTLGEFKIRIIREHARKIEGLMLECFRSLLRKSELVSGLAIDPRTFAVTLLDRAGQPLPFDRLSAGERQLLATSMLWGLARASGRPVPTIIDTPLGRLDSSHRRHVTERYFPFASHQVLLLSTDEEIVGSYYETLKPFIARTYHLAHDDKLGRTSMNPGYFPQHETAS